MDGNPPIQLTEEEWKAIVADSQKILREDLHLTSSRRLDERLGRIEEHLFPTTTETDPVSDDGPKPPPSKTQKRTTDDPPTDPSSAPPKVRKHGWWSNYDTEG